MKIGIDPTPQHISIETKLGTYLFMETDKGAEIHTYPNNPMFDKCMEKDIGEVFSGAVYTDTYTKSRFYLILYVDTRKGAVGDEDVALYILVSLDSGGNAYGISSPMACHWNKADPNSPMCTKEEMLKIIEDHWLERADMRASAVPGQCGWHRCHIEDCSNIVGEHVTFDGDVVKPKGEG